MPRPQKFPWDKIRADYETGMFDQKHIINKYGVDSGALSRKIKKEKWTINQKANEAMTSFDTVNQNLSDLLETNPLLAESTLEQMAKRDPDLVRLVMDANKAVLKQASTTASQVFGADLNATAKAVQTASDSLGLTQRHAPRAETKVEVQTNIVTHGDAVAEALKRKHQK